jgi:hypothetical protein
MADSDLMRSIMARASEEGARVFRNNVGAGWIGEPTYINRPQTVRLQKGDVVIRAARRIEFGLVAGASDIIGATPVLIRSEHVGETFALFTGIEVKEGSGRSSKPQKTFAEVMSGLGGLVGVARSVDDALTIVRARGSARG